MMSALSAWLIETLGFPHEAEDPKAFAQRESELRERLSWLEHEVDVIQRVDDISEDQRE